jgi:hypothetical protein
LGDALTSFREIAAPVRMRRVMGVESSGLVSHYGSSPSSSARRSTIDLAGKINLFDRRRTDWQHQPRMTTGAFVLQEKLPRLRSGFRRAARTPRKRLNFDCAAISLREIATSLRMTRDKVRW